MYACADILNEQYKWNFSFQNDAVIKKYTISIELILLKTREIARVHTQLMRKSIAAEASTMVRKQCNRVENGRKKTKFISDSADAFINFIERFSF